MTVAYYMPGLHLIQTLSQEQHIINFYTVAQRKFSQVMRPFGKFGRHCPLGNNPLYGSEWT